MVAPASGRTAPAAHLSRRRRPSHRPARSRERSLAADGPDLTVARPPPVCLVRASLALRGAGMAVPPLLFKPALRHTVLLRISEARS